MDTIEALQNEAVRYYGIMMEYWEYLCPVIEALIDKHPDLRNVYLDVGPAEGIVTREFVKRFSPKQIILADLVCDFSVLLPTPAYFEFVDVSDARFVKKFRHRPTFVTCIRSFHEFEFPIQAAFNLMSIIPPQGILFIADNSQETWEGISQKISGKVESTQAHFAEDMFRMRNGFGLHTNKGIKRFWEDRIFPQLSDGVGELHFVGGQYIVAYQAK